MAHETNLDKLRGYGLTSMRLKADNDETCPICGAPLDGYIDLDFTGNGIRLANRCPECGSRFNFFYRLDYASIIDDQYYGKE